MTQKLTDFPLLQNIENDDLLYIVDVSDTTDSPEGSSKATDIQNIRKKLFYPQNAAISYDNKERIKNINIGGRTRRFSYNENDEITSIDTPEYTQNFTYESGKITNTQITKKHKI